MFRWLGRGIIRIWPAMIIGWLSLAGALKFTAPSWDSVATDGELRHLPNDMPSRQGTELYQKAFPQDVTDSSLVLILYRKDNQLSQLDERFITGQLVPGLREISGDLGGVMQEPRTPELLQKRIAEELEQLGIETQLASKSDPPSQEGDAPKSETSHTKTPDDTRISSDRSIAQNDAAAPPSDGNSSHSGEVKDDGESEMPRVVSISSIGDFVIGPMLRSADGHATLVSLNLTSGFLKTQNKLVASKVAKYVAQLREGDDVPKGLQIALSGSTMVGVDTISAVTQSTQAVRMWATWIVIALLLAVYRAPVAAILPLVTMYVSVEIAIAALAWGAYFQLIEVFDGLVLYVSVIVYGAGVDYSLFIISRHQEEVYDGQPTKEAALISIVSAGTAVAASAGTEIVGVGLLSFAEFGKFQQAGIGISVGLVILLLASLTLTPALLCLAGHWTFWPATPANSHRKQRRSNRVLRFWRRLGIWQQLAPGRVWIGTMLLLMPVAVYGALNVNRQTYDLTSSLPDDSVSLRGMETLSEYFSEGATGPVTVMIHDPATDFSSPAGLQKIADFTEKLQQRADELEIASIRSLADPLGTTARSEQLAKLLGSIVQGLEFLNEGELVVPDNKELTEAEKVVQQLIREQAYSHYVSSEQHFANHVTWLTITPTTDPYASESIRKIEGLEKAIQEELKLEAADAEVYLIGATSSLRDVRNVAKRDFRRIAVMIPLGVLVVLIVLLRKLIIPIYLMFTVLLTFTVTIGVTTALFSWLDPIGFTGLQWTVPVLLFVLLVAVGEDYSVLLVTRTEEEQQKHGPTRGITEALASTGGLISGAGLIMAGTFAALALGGTLEGMQQLGFALAFGVLLDTFVVRPLLVPSFQHLLLRWSRKQPARSATTE